MSNLKTKFLDKYPIKDRRKFPFVALILILPLTHIILFFFIVNFSAISLAFQDEYGKFSFESIIYVFRGFTTGIDRFGNRPLEMLWKSMVLWGTQHVIGYLISIITSYMLTKHMIGSKFFRVIYVIPSIVGAVVFSKIMMGMYAANGIITQLLVNVGFELPEKVLLFGLLGCDETAYFTLVVQVLILTIAGGNMIMAGAYMKIPEEIFESCKIEGCGFAREIFQITIPCAWPTISTIFTFALCSFFTADYGFYLYSRGTGDYGIVSIGFYLYKIQANIAENNAQYMYGFASAFGMFITLITLPVVLIGRKLMSKVETVEF